MPITALPQPTVRAIGSTSVITDSCSIVKELLDNALDASASSVFVEVSKNTVDVIQVKDNGHGIASEDHAVVCKRTFTNKIETVDDLRNIGGKYLGFRGEALASAAEMSGCFSVTTRTETEMVGSNVKYGRDGELISSQRTSHPVGTTIRVTDFLKHIPVRRQTALKSAGKTLSRIKKLMQAYAMSQPSKRLSLKVIKAENETNNWMYAGSHNASLMDAAMKVVGTEAASHCMVSEWPPEGSFTDCTIVAVLAKEDADLTKINNASQYLSVDGRPLATGRGIARDIIKLYRNYLRSANPGGDSKTMNDPFLCLQIQCPPGSYDTNIEPTKDDVLFEHPRRILSLAEDLFHDTYGELTSTKNKRSNKGREKPANNGFELLMARKSSGPSTQLETPRESPMSSSSTPLKTPLPRDFRDFSVRDEDGTPQAENETQDRDLEGLDPWSMTKLNASFRTPFRTPMKAGSSTVPLITNINTAQREPAGGPQGSTRMLPASTKTSFPSPSASNPVSNSISTSPTDTRPSPSTARNTQNSSATLTKDKIRRRERDRERYGNGALDTWFQKITQAGLRRDEGHASEDGHEYAVDQESDEKQGPSSTQLAQSRFVSEQSPPTSSTSAGDLFTQDDPEDTQATQVSQLLTQNRGSTSPNRPLEATRKRQEQPVLEKWSARLHQRSQPQLDEEVKRALEFEHCKKEAIRKRREEIRNRSEPPTSTNSPHHSRYLAARAMLNRDLNKRQGQGTASAEEPTPKPALSQFDPRAYQIRQAANHHELPKDGKVRRILASKLPLEKIPEGYDVHDVCLTMPLDLSGISCFVKNNPKIDLHTQSGDEFEALASSSENLIGLWNGRLSELIRTKYQAGDGAPSVKFDFSAVRHLPLLD